MKKHLIISIFLLAGLNGFGQKIKPITELQSKYKNEYAISENIVKLEIDLKQESEKGRSDLNPSAEYRNVSFEFDSCSVLKMKQCGVNIALLDSLDKHVKKLNFNNPYADTVYYVQVTQNHLNINPYSGVNTLGVTYNTNCNLTKLKI